MSTPTTESTGFQPIEAVRQPDGRVGIRARVLVLPSVICSHLVAESIAGRRASAVASPHDHGCAQIGADNEQTADILVGLGSNPNVAGTVVVGLGCEEVQSSHVVDRLAARGIPNREVVIQAVGGTDPCIDAGVDAVDELTTAVSPVEPAAGFDSLVVGVVVSDLEQSTLRNCHPLIAKTIDQLVDGGARVVVAGADRFLPFREETTAAIGDTASVEGLFDRLEDVPPRHRHIGLRVRASGFENATGFVGETPIDRVIQCGDRLRSDPGVTLLEAPSRFEEATTALAAAGVHMVVHVTAHGEPAGHPVVPVIKISGDRRILEAIPDDIDIDATDANYADVLTTLTAVANGDPSAAERHGLTTVAIPRIGPSL